MMSKPFKGLALGLMALSVLATMALMLDTLWSQSGWPKHRVLHQEVQALLQENDKLGHKLTTLKREIAAQAERPEVQEALVRDLLGYVRDNDIIVRLDHKP